MKNKSWFEKILRHFQKTIRHFQKTIRHFQKTIRRLKRSRYSLTQHDQLGHEQQVHSVAENRCEIIVEYFLFSRAYAYTLEFYLFCCHCCHSFLWNSLFCNILRTSFGHLLIDKRSTGQNRPITPTRNTLFALPLTYFLHLFSPCVTLVTAKKRNCCSIRASMRALRAGPKTSALPTDLLRFSFPPGFSAWIFRDDFPRGFIA